MSNAADRIPAARTSGARTGRGRDQDQSPTRRMVELTPPRQMRQRFGHSDSQRRREVASAALLDLDHTAPSRATVWTERPRRRAGIDSRCEPDRMIAKHGDAVLAPLHTDPSASPTLTRQHQIERCPTDTAPCPKTADPHACQCASAHRQQPPCTTGKLSRAVPESPSAPSIQAPHATTCRPRDRCCSTGKLLGHRQRTRWWATRRRTPPAP